MTAWERQVRRGIGRWESLPHRQCPAFPETPDGAEFCSEVEATEDLVVTALAISVSGLPPVLVAGFSALDSGSCCIWNPVGLPSTVESVIDT